MQDETLDLKTVRGNGVQAKNINLDDNADVLEHIEQDQLFRQFPRFTSDR